MKRFITVLLLLTSTFLYGAKVVDAILEGGAIHLTVDNAQNTVTVQNTTADKTAVFNVYNAATFQGQPAGAVLVWTYQQDPASSNTIAIPTTDNFGNPITWQVGQVTTKGGTKIQTVTSPPWQLTMQ